MTLRETRESLGLTKMDLAVRAGVHWNTIYRIEGKGCKVMPRTWCAIERALFDAAREQAATCFTGTPTTMQAVTALRRMYAPSELRWIAEELFDGTRPSHAGTEARSGVTPAQTMEGRLDLGSKR